MYRLLVSILLLIHFVHAEEKQTICLNMIVKNEAKIIQRCLDSVKNIIDYWVIVDTGSTDGTQEVIQAYMEGIPGELYERPWKNWGETRSEAFDLAAGKGDYILFMDADDILEFDEDFEMPFLTADQYTMWRGTKSFSYLKPQIVKGDLPWKWVGVTHEYLGIDQAYSTEILEGIHYTSIDDGATHCDPEKYWKNVRLLEEGLKKEPNNTRYAFYLAESYRDAGEKGKALECFQKRVKMGGWDEETFCSKLQIGHMLKAIGMSDPIVTEAYKEAYLFRPHRIEGAYYLAEMYNKQGKHDKAYELLKIRTFMPQFLPKDSLFNENWIEQYGLLFQLSICSYYVGHYEESIALCNQLIANPDLPESWRKQAEENRNFPLAKLEEVQKTDIPIPEKTHLALSDNHASTPSPLPTNTSAESPQRFTFSNTIIWTAFAIAMIASCLYYYRRKLRPHLKF